MSDLNIRWVTVSAEHGLRALFLDGVPAVLIGVIVVCATIDTFKLYLYACQWRGRDYFTEGGGVAFLFCFCFDPGCHFVVVWHRTHCVAQAGFN